MVNRTRRAAVLAVALAVALVLAACARPAQEPQAGGPPPEPEGPQGELVVATPADAGGSWDPIDTFLLVWGMVGNQIFDGLVERGPDLELKPGLAERWEFVDDSTLRFYLRQGVVFHNGEPFNADAVKFTFDRLLGPEGAKGPQQANYTSIDRVEVVDEYTVDFKMKVKDPVIVTKLAGYGAMIVPPRYIQEVGDETFNTHPVGTGPFKVVEYVKDDHLTLEANPDYWKGPPKLAKVTYRFIPEATTQLAELQTGNVDIVPWVPVSQAQAVKADSNLELVEVGSPTVSVFRFNHAKDPVDDVKVRLAIAHAIDVQAIIDTVLQGYGRRVASFQSPLSFGHDPDLQPYPYDPEKAKALLAEAGVAPGTKLVISFVGTATTVKEIVQAMASYLQAVGFTVELQPMENQSYWSEAIPNAQVGQLYYFGWGGWTLDFDNTAYLLYHEGEFWNPTFKDEAVEQLLQQERTTYDQKVREAAFHQLVRRLQELAPEIPLYQTINLWAVNKRVKGFVAPPDDRIFLHGVSVEPQ